MNKFLSQAHIHTNCAGRIHVLGINPGAKKMANGIASGMIINIRPNGSNRFISLRVVLIWCKRTSKENVNNILIMILVHLPGSYRKTIRANMMQNKTKLSPVEFLFDSNRKTLYEICVPEQRIICNSRKAALSRSYKILPFLWRARSSLFSLYQWMDHL